MSKLGNILWKGLKTGAHVAVGTLAYGAAVYVFNIHFSNPLYQGVWNYAGPAIAGIGIGAAARWAAWDPSKQPQPPATGAGN